MSREEVAAHLRNLQLSLDGLQRSVEGRIGALPDTRRDELPAVLAGVRRHLQRFLGEQVRELEAFAEEAGWEVRLAARLCVWLVGQLLVPAAGCGVGWLER